jgi:hypothetical protein
MRYDLQALQAISDQGLDIMPAVTLTMADADKTLYSWDRTHGIAGARLSLVFAYHDQGGQYSSDSYKVFIGRCKPAGADFETFTITATSLLNLNQKRLPVTPIQRTCPNIHPDTADEKALADKPGSLFYRCGDTTLGNTSCDRSPANCKTNGMWDLGRFSGIEGLGNTAHKEFATIAQWNQSFTGIICARQAVLLQECSVKILINCLGLSARASVWKACIN